jgi:hypothetical protein
VAPSDGLLLFLEHLVQLKDIGFGWNELQGHFVQGASIFGENSPAPQYSEIECRKQNV